ncbi:MAG: ATP-binding protein [Anaerosomatales bacterium]|nr:ATP-binding protein [Anaerosomatales bacterium]
MSKTKLHNQATRAGLALAAGLGVYFFTRIAMDHVMAPEPFAPVWVASGIGVAAAVLLGPWVLPVLGLATFLASITAAPWYVALVAGVLIVVEAAVARRVLGGSWAPRSTPLAKGVVRFGAAAVAGAATAATLGLVVIASAGAEVAPVLATWGTWFVADLAGIVLVAPAIMLWWADERELGWSRAWEGALAALLIIALAFFGYSSRFPAALDLALPFMFLPPFIWMAFRCERRGVAVVTAVAALITQWGTFHGHGPFAGSTPFFSAVTLDIVLSVFGFSVLIMTTFAAERRRGLAELERSHAELEARVARRTTELAETVAEMQEEIALRERAEAELVQRESWFRLLYEQAPLAYQSLDSKGVILDVNERWLELLGMSREDVIGRRFGEFVVAEQQVSMLRRFVTFRRRGVTEAQYDLVRADGDVITCAVYGRTSGEGDGLRTHCILQDVTERLAMEREVADHRERLETLVYERTADLDAAYHELEAASRAKDEFLANMSHELRTPLNSIIGFSDLLLSGRVGSLEGEQERQIAMINTSGHHLLDLVNDVLDLSRITSGRFLCTPEVIEPAAIAGSVVAALRPLAERKGLSVRLDASRAPRSFVSDARALRQVLLNLVGNAIKFTTVGEVVVTLSTEDADTLVITVADTGPGVPAEDLPHIFEEFYQASSAEKGRPDGTGLGLSISRRLVELLEGSIEVASAIGTGSAFTVRLPHCVTVE